MAYFAQLDNDDNVLRVIVADQAFIDSGAVGNPSSWVESPGKGKDGAAKGKKFDRGLGKFIAKKPFPSWQLDEADGQWYPPNPNARTIPTASSVWNEQLKRWEETE